MPKAKESEPREQRHIQSIEVGFRVVRAIQQTGSNASLKAIAEAAGMPTAKAHLYLVSFVRQGLVVQDPANQRYSLGPYAIELGLAAIQQIDLTAIAREPMQALQDRVRLPVFLSVWGNFGPTIIFKLDRITSLPVVIRMGYVLPLLSSATGHLFLAHLSDTDVADTIERETDGKVDVELVRSLRASVLRHGLATSKGFPNLGFASLACGIFDHDHELEAAVTIFGFPTNLDADPTGETANLLRTTAATISAAHGARG